MTKWLALILCGAGLMLSCGKYTQETRIINEEISSCGLVVRLSDRSAQADRLRANGDAGRADYVLQKDRENNLALYQDFSEHCGFTSVYFIFKKDTERFLKGDRKDIFLNNKLEYSDQRPFTCDDFYFIDYGEIDAENEVQRADDWIVKDQNLKPLERPFPWRVNYPLDCIGKGKKSEAQCLCYKIQRYIEKGDAD